MKADLRQAEDELVKVLAGIIKVSNFESFYFFEYLHFFFYVLVKTRKEAKQMGLRDSISATQSRIQLLKRSLQLHKSNKEEQSKTISHRLQGKCDSACFNFLS